MELIYLLIGLVVLIVVISLLWKAGDAAVSLAPFGQTGRTLLYIVALLILAAIVWYFFGGFVRLPR